MKRGEEQVLGNFPSRSGRQDTDTPDGSPTTTLQDTDSEVSRVCLQYGTLPLIVGHEVLQGLVVFSFNTV